MAENQKAQEIFGRLLQSPEFLIQSIWDNNSNGLVFVLKQNGLPSVNSPKDIYNLMLQEISSGAATGQQWAYILGTVPYSQVGAEYTTTPDFQQAFKMFDEFMGIKD